MVGMRCRGSDRIEGQQRLVSEGGKEFHDPAEGCRPLREAYPDLFLQKINAGMEYSRIEGMQLFQEPDTGRAVHPGNRKGDHARGSIGELPQTGCGFRIFQVGKPSVACGRHRPPRKVGDRVVGMQALLMKELVNRQASRAAKPPFAGGVISANRQSAMEAGGGIVLWFRFSGVYPRRLHGGRPVLNERKNLEEKDTKRGENSQPEPAFLPDESALY